MLHNIVWWQTHTILYDGFGIQTFSSLIWRYVFPPLAKLCHPFSPINIVPLFNTLCEDYHLGADYMENFSPAFRYKLEKRSSQLHEESFSPGWKIQCNSTRKFQPRLKRWLTGVGNANCQNNKGYRLILARVHVRFKFQLGLKYFM